MSDIKDLIENAYYLYKPVSAFNCKINIGKLTGITENELIFIGENKDDNNDFEFSSLTLKIPTDPTKLTTRLDLNPTYNVKNEKAAAAAAAAKTANTSNRVETDEEDSDSISPGAPSNTPSDTPSDSTYGSPSDTPTGSNKEVGGKRRSRSAISAFSKQFQLPMYSNKKSKRRGSGNRKKRNSRKNRK